MSKELKPKDFNRLSPHMPIDLKIPTAVLFKMNGCGWCKKMEPEWDEVGEKVGFMNICHFTTDASKENNIHWEKIENSLETRIEGFPSVMFYKPNGSAVLHTGFCSADEMIAKMINYCEDSHL